MAFLKLDWGMKETQANCFTADFGPNILISIGTSTPAKKYHRLFGNSLPANFMINFLLFKCHVLNSKLLYM